MKKIVEELNERDIDHRIQLSVIQNRCLKEIHYAERTGDMSLIRFAEEIMNMAQIKEGR